MLKRENGVNTICSHTGSVVDKIYGGAVSPIYPSTSYSFVDKITNRYPRYFNTPNQEFLAKKIAALEKAESALIFSSGMAAISSNEPASSSSTQSMEPAGPALSDNVAAPGEPSTATAPESMDVA